MNIDGYRFIEEIFKLWVMVPKGVKNINSVAVAQKIK